MFAFVITTCWWRLASWPQLSSGLPSPLPAVDCERDQNQLLSHWVHYLPDVWCISWNVLFASGIKVIFCPFHSRFHSLVLSPQFPPHGIVILLSDLNAENSPSPLDDQDSKRKESHLTQSHLHQGVYVGFYKTKFKEIKLMLKFILFTAVYPAGKLVSVSFERNCGVASVGEYNKVIRYYQLLIIVDSANWPPSRVSKLTKVDNVKLATGKSFKADVSSVPSSSFSQTKD